MAEKVPCMNVRLDGRMDECGNGGQKHNQLQTHTQICVCAAFTLQLVRPEGVVLAETLIALFLIRTRIALREC